ncbi:MAG TPA: Na+/H+ antiporter [Terriglobales bacterium]|jgi:CPA1 family monovalent cation:H+ antiporter
MSSSVQAVELVFLLLLLFVVAFGALARKLKVPYPIVLVIAGALLGFVPGIPPIALNPDIVFFVVLPPLIYSAAWLTSWREFSFNMVSILLLAFGLVAFTVFGIASAAKWLFTGFDWQLGFVLGAVVAPTDAIAATSIAQRIGLPKRIVDILEGESLVNDASGLLALEFGIAMVVRNQTLTIGGGLLRLLYLTLVGLLVGLVTGWIVNHLERRIDHGPIEIAISILVPYVAYLGAEAIHSSGVLAVVACGLYLSRRSSDFFSPGVRLQVWSVWEALTFILNGLVFVMIGLQLPYVLAGIHGYSLRTLVLYGALFSALLIALRMIWIFPGTYLAYLIRTRVFHQSVQLPSATGILVVGWTGMRGVIALAAAISLPQMLDNGSAFPERNLIIFLAFSAIFVTLVLQGLTLPFLVRLLHLSDASTPNIEEETARREILQAGLAYLEEARKNDDKEFTEIYNDLSGHYQQRLTALSNMDHLEDGAKLHERFSQLSHQLLRVERQTAVRLRNQGRINDEILREFERDLDLREAGYHAKGNT